MQVTTVGLDLAKRTPRITQSLSSPRPRLQGGWVFASGLAALICDLRPAAASVPGFGVTRARFAR